MENTNRPTRKSFKIVFALIAVVIMGAIGAIVGVYAATQQTVKSSFSVGYSIGKNIAVAVGGFLAPNANPSPENRKWFTATGLPQQENGLYTVGASVTTTSVNLNCEEHVMPTDGNLMAEIYLYFENLSNKAIKLSYTDTGIVKNIRLHYTGGIVTEVGNAVWDQIVAGQYYTIQPGEIFSFYVFYDLPNKNASAHYISTAGNGLSFNIQQA